MSTALIVVLLAVIGFQQVVDTDAQVKSEFASIYFFHGPSYDDHTIYELKEATSLLDHPNFKPGLNTTIYIHGYQESTTADSVQHIIEAYLSNGNYNTLVLDWGALAANFYTTAVEDMIKVGDRMVQVLLSLFHGGLSIGKFHLVGHSLGGQMAGVIGYGIQVRTNKKVILPRITALDPAGPMFGGSLGNGAGSKRPLQPQDAKFVDVIHTDAGVAGIDNTCGTVDFWPNSGKQTQPGCRNGGLACNHQRSWLFWSESLVRSSDPHIFKSVKAGSYIHFQKGEVHDSPIISMGINCPKDATGSYYLNTAANFPFSLGLDGIKSYQRRASKSEL